MIVHVYRWFVAIIIYMLIVLSLLAFRPSLMFDANGDPKPVGLGLGEGYSFFAPVVAFPIIAMFSYFVAALLHVVMV